MTVAELIEQLQKQDQSAEVVYLNENIEYEGVSGVYGDEYYTEYGDGQFGTNVVELA